MIPPPLNGDETRACLQIRDLYKVIVDEFGENRGRELWKGMTGVLCKRPRGRPKGSRKWDYPPTANRDTEKHRRQRNPFYRLMSVDISDRPEPGQKIVD